MESVMESKFGKAKFTKCLKENEKSESFPGDRNNPDSAHWPLGQKPPLKAVGEIEAREAT